MRILSNCCWWSYNHCYWCRYQLDYCCYIAPSFFSCELLCTILDRIAAHCIGKNELHCVCFSEMFLWLVEYATFVQCDLCWLAVTSRQIFSVYRHLKIAFNWIQSDEYIYFVLRLSLLSFSCNDCFLVFFLFFLNLIYSISCFFKLVTTLLLIPIKKISLLTLI